MYGMTRQDLMNEINVLTEQLNAARNSLSKAKLDLLTLEEFSAQCNSRITAFENSISKRRRRLSGVEGITGSVRMALRYKEKMNEMLSGKTFHEAISQIEQLRFSVTNERNKLTDTIIELSGRVSFLQEEIRQFQYAYSDYPEEVDGNEL